MNPSVRLMTIAMTVRLMISALTSNKSFPPLDDYSLDCLLNDYCVDHHTSNKSCCLLDDYCVDRLFDDYRVDYYCFGARI